MKERSDMASLTEPEQQSPDIFIPQEWVGAATKIAHSCNNSRPLIALICGPKNCGKSTFSRFLVNTLLRRHKKACYLDTDVGQPEFTPPGFLSLTVIEDPILDLKVPCLKTPDRCFYFGDVSSKSDPAMYLRYIYTLSDYYHQDSNFLLNEHAAVTKLPLVVNTPGWVKGIGYDVLVDMVKYIAPTHVTKINISANNKNLPAGVFWLDDDDGKEVYLSEIHSALVDSLNRSILVRKHACDLRDLRLMAYFRQCFPCNLNITKIKELSKALTCLVPYEVLIHSIIIKHLDHQVSPSETYYSLNASVVGLAISSEHSENLPWCVGLGIVRGVDTSKGVMYLITPVPLSILENVDLLLRGTIQVPACLLQVKGCVPPYMSYNVLSEQVVSGHGS